MHTRLTLLAAVFSLLVSGCLTQERDITSYNEDVEYFENQDYYDYGNIDAEEGQLFGNIGPMQDLEMAAKVAGYDEGEYSSIEVLGENNEGAAMHLIDIHGGIRHPALTPGAEMTFRTGNYPSESNEIHIEVMACAGESAYMWDYDEPAETVHVSVSETEDPDVIQIDYTTEVQSQPVFGLPADETSSGRFLLRR
jgi:hypothetical protein